MTRRLLLFAFFLLLPALGRAEVSFQSTFSFENLNFPANRNTYSKNDQETFEADFRFTFENEKNFKSVINPRVKLDFVDHRRNRYLPNEAYALFYTPHHEFTGGLELRHWGSANSFNPTDVLNRRDFEDNFYNPEKLGELMLSWKGSTEKMGALQEPTLTLIALPFFQAAPLPDRDTRFSLDGKAGFIPYTFLNRAERLDYPEAMGIAAGFSGSFAPADFSLHYYHGPERNPGYVLRLDSQGALRLVPFYYVLDMIGFNASGAKGKFIPHVEAAYKMTSANPPHPHDINFENNNAIPDNYFQYVPGLDYTIENLFKTAATLRLSLEYLGEASPSNTLRNFRPFQNDLFFGAHADFWGHRGTQAQAGLIKDLSNNELALLLDFSTKVYKELKVNFGGVLLNPTEKKFSPLSYFGNNSYLRVGLSYSKTIKSTL